MQANTAAAAKADDDQDADAEEGQEEPDFQKTESQVEQERRQAE